MDYFRQIIYSISTIDARVENDPDRSLFWLIILRGLLATLLSKPPGGGTVIANVYQCTKDEIFKSFIQDGSLLTARIIFNIWIKYRYFFIGSTRLIAAESTTIIVSLYQSTKKDEAFIHSRWITFDTSNIISCMNQKFRIDCFFFYRFRLYKK